MSPLLQASSSDTYCTFHRQHLFALKTSSKSREHTEAFSSIPRSPKRELVEEIRIVILHVIIYKRIRKSSWHTCREYESCGTHLSCFSNVFPLYLENEDSPSLYTPPPLPSYSHLTTPTISFRRYATNTVRPAFGARSGTPVIDKAPNQNAGTSSVSLGVVRRSRG
jgi:hypothetical protein